MTATEQQQVMRGLENIARKHGPAATLAGEVTAVDEAATTCRVKLADGMELTDVQLHAVKDASKGVLIIPKVGAYVVILDIGNPDYLVIHAEEIDKVVLKIKEQTTIQVKDQELTATMGQSKLKMDASGFSLERSGESLTALLKDILQAIQQLTVTTSTGPSGVPINNPAFAAIAQRIPNLLQ